MKTKLARVLLISIAALVLVAPSALAQRQLGKKKGPTSKLYVAESTGDTQIQNNDKVYAGRQGTAFDAPGTVIETKADAHNAFVYSNGTGMFVDQNTRVEIDHFEQEPFQANRSAPDTSFEPSASQSSVRVAHGAVGLCTSKLVSGSSMLYTTPEATVNIRGGRIAIETNDNVTTIDLLEGDVTVRGGSLDLGGQILRPGERAVIRAAPAGQPATVTISPIPADALNRADERTSIACNAKKTVTFEVIEKKAVVGLDATPENTTAADLAAGTVDTSSGADNAQDLVAKPTVPAATPQNIVISPDRLPGT